MIIKIWKKLIIFFFIIFFSLYLKYISTYSNNITETTNQNESIINKKINHLFEINKSKNNKEKTHNIIEVDTLNIINSMIYNNKIIAVPFSTPLQNSQINELKSILPSLNKIYNNYDYNNLISKDTIIHSHSESEILSYMQLPEIKFLWSFRGGYGSARLLNNKDILKIKNFSSKKTDNLVNFNNNNKKVIIGFSDVTYIMIATYQLFGWHNIHGDCLYQIVQSGEEKNPMNIKNIVNLLSGKVKKIYIPKIIPIGNISTKMKDNLNISGKMTGGNLEIIISTIGTPYEIKTDNHILMLEDTNINSYRFARNLNHMIQAGKFNNVLAVVFGTVNDKNNLDSSCFEKIIDEFAEWANFPVYKTISFGHEYNNYPWIYGADAIIEKEQNSNMQIKVNVPSLFLK
ncbi:LD-carboxypeptidase [Lyticum sinuosum]|uniref:LD-carboxypeptidase n=1 Tax=Lyticum sinuosum TaxID=1332059 RepID=A0AAE4VKE7_9RICK|nr:LD-carboxypeptidase [Lyticum sinuosum]MDZ5761150.1 LD-carboxypeptidase [Lyticum sinuosum]